MRFPFARIVVLAPNKSVRPIAIVSKREVINGGRSGAMPCQVWLERFRAFDVTVRNLQCKILRRVPGDAAAVGIESWLIEIVAVFVRLTAGENAAFDFQVAPNNPARGDTERNMCGILPVVAERRVRIIHRRRAMHESGRSERRFAWITKIQIRAQTVFELLRITNRQFIEQIVRMLPVVQWLVVPRFAALK